MSRFDYSSGNRRWQRLRQQALRRDGYRCQESIRYGKIVEATHVHHIWPAEDYRNTRTASGTWSALPRKNTRRCTTSGREN